MAVGSVGLLRNCGRFIMGEWAQPVGRMCYEARKNKTNPTSIFSFAWKNTCKDYWAGVDKTKALRKSLMDTINQAGKGLTGADKARAIRIKGIEFAKTATKQITSKGEKKAIRDMISKTIKSEAKEPGFFSKIGKFLGKIPGMKFVGKNIFPIMIGIQTIQSAIEGYKDGGIGGALKEAARGLLQMGGYALALAGTAALGMTGIGALVVPFLFSSFVLDKGINLVLGKSPAEKQEEQQQLAQTQQETQSTNPFVMAASKNEGRSLSSFGSNADFKEKMKALDAMLKPIHESMANRHKCYLA